MSVTCLPHQLIPTSQLNELAAELGFPAGYNLRAKLQWIRNDPRHPDRPAPTPVRLSNGYAYRVSDLMAVAAGEYELPTRRANLREARSSLKSIHRRMT